MEQTIRYCTSPDGVKIAYASSGSGYPLVVCQGWMGHLELDWAFPPSRALWRSLSERYRVIRFDRRGTGLSDRNVENFSLEAQTGDLAAVVEASGERSVALLGYSAGGPVVISYAAAHSGAVSHVILYGTYASGSYTAIEELAKALYHMIKADWGGMGSVAMADIYIPGASTEQRQAFALYQQQCATREVALGQAASVAEFKVKHLLGTVEAPALVIHKRGDKAVPFELGRRLARDLPDARFVPLEGDSHLIWVGGANETIAAIFDFLAEAGAERAAGLSGREAEVLRLVAAGRSNRQIGEELTISINTVDRHVSNIMSKIGATNRAEAASFAVRNGLA